MKQLNYSIVFMILVTGACTKKPKSLKEQASYVIGAKFGKSLREQNLDLDSGFLSRGIAEGYSGGELRLTEEEMQKALKGFDDKKKEGDHQLAEKNMSQGENFLAENKEREGVEVLPSGLQIEPLVEGTGPLPKDGDTVVVNYTAKTIDGAIFDTSASRRDPTQFHVKNVIPGWSEGIMRMKKGGKANIFVPPSLGYGERRMNRIPPGSVLIFETELVDIKFAPPKPKGKH